MKNGIEFYYNISNKTDKILEYIKNGEWQKVNNVKREDRSNSIIYYFDRTKDSILFNFVDEIFKKYLNDYRSKYYIPQLKYMSIEALKYEPGEKYVMHFDNGSKHVANRITSTVIYLNDDYEGGEIEFTNFDIKIKPQKSSIAIFPSNYPYMHVAHQVTNGVRYALNIFTEYE